MPQQITRQTALSVPLTIGTTVAASQGLSLSTDAGAMVLIESRSTSAQATITFFCKLDENAAASFQLISDTGSAVAQTVTTPTTGGQCFPLPDGCFAARFVIPVISTGTAVIRIVTKT